MKKSHISKFILSFAFIILALASFGGVYLQNTSLQNNDNIYAEDTIEIKDQTGLAEIAKNVNNENEEKRNTYEGQTIYLKNDIDLSGKVWTPIGTMETPFKGTFDGRGFTIHGLTITSELMPSLSYVGLFGYTNGAIIRNVTLDLINIDYSGSTSVGGLVGTGVNTKIYDCATYGSVKGSGNIGGIVGSLTGGNYSTLSHSYSYAKVEYVSSSNSLGGLVGNYTVRRVLISSTGGRPRWTIFTGTISNSFFAGITSTNYSGLYASGSAKVSNVYTINCLPLSGDSDSARTDGFVTVDSGGIKQYTKIDNEDSWIKDPKNLMGHGTNKKVLRGVGNIVREIIQQSFNVSNGRYQNKSNTGEVELLKSTVYASSTTTNSFKVVITPSANNTFTFVRYTRVVNDNTNQIISNRGDFLNNVKINNNMYTSTPGNPNKDIDLLYEEKTDITFNVCESFASSIKPTTTYELNSKSFIVPENMQGYYKIETYERGKLQKITSYVKTYKNPIKSEFENAKYINAIIGKSVTDTINEYYNQITEEFTISQNTSSPYSRPYGEEYTVKFQNNTNFDYIGKLNGYKKATTDDSVGTILKSQLKNEFSIKEKIGSTITGKGINYYFDNVLEVTLDDGRQRTDKFDASYFTKWDSNYTAKDNEKSKAINVMLYELVSDKGIGYNGEIISTISAGGTGSQLFPFWSDFSCVGIKDDDNKYYFKAQSESVLSSNKGNVTNERWEAKNLIWYPEWASKSQDNIKISTNTVDGKSPVQDIKINKGTLVTSGNFLKLETDTSVTNYVFNVTQKGGYRLQFVELKMTIENKDLDSKFYNSSRNYSYFGCRLSYNANETRYKVQSKYECTILPESGTYQFTFSTLIGVESITFNFEKYEFNAKIKTDKGSTISDYNNSPIMIDGTNIDNNGKTLSDILGDNAKLLSVNSDIQIKNIVVKAGYKILGVTLPTETVNGHSVELSQTLTKSNDDSYILTLTLNSIDPLANLENDIEIIFNIQQINKEFDFSINLDTNNDDFKNFEFGIAISNSGSEDATRSATPSRCNLIRKYVYTDDVIKIIFNNLPYGIKLTTFDFNGLKISGLKIDKSKDISVDSNLLIISNVVVDDSTDEFYIRITFEIPKIKLTIKGESVSLNNGVEQINSLDSHENIEISYGTALTITKDAYSRELNVNINDTTQNEINNYIYEINPNFVEQLTFLFQTNVINNMNVKDNVAIKWGPTYLTYAKLLELIGSGDVLKENSSYILTIRFIYKTITVRTGEALIQNGSNIITSYTQLDEKQMSAGSEGSVTANNITGYKFIGYYIVQKSPSGQISGDIFTRNLLHTNTNLVYALNKDSSGIKINIENSILYIVKVYEAKKLTAVFKTDLKDNATNENLEVSLSNTAPIQIEFNTKVSSSILPTAQINGMYDFVCWQSKSVILSNADFKIDEKYDIDDDNDTVIFVIKATPTTVVLTLYSDVDKVFGTANISYATLDYSKIAQPSKFGYTLVGWKYKYKDSDGEINKAKDEQLYVSIQNGKVVQSACKKFDIQSKTVDFVAVYEANIISNIKFRAGGINNEGKFVSGQKEYTAQVMFGTSDYKSDLFSLSTFAPTWETNYATYEFAYFIFNDDTNKIYDPNSTDESRKYIIKSTEISGDMIFTAYYKVVDFVTPSIVGSMSNWTYDAQARSITLNFNNKQNTNVLTYSYAWYKDGKALTGKTDLILDNIKNVVDSGKYVCRVKVNAKNNYAFTESQIEKDTDEFLITITPKEIWFTQNDLITTELVKVFDNTNKTDSSVGYDGVCGGDNITVIATYDNVNVGTNISMTITLSATGSTTDVRNYTYPTDITGTITPYELNFVLKNQANNYVVKNGEDNLQINIKEYYNLASDDSSFMQRYGFAIDFEIKTSQNIIGEYSYNNQNGNDILLSFVLKSGNSNNFIGTVDDSFFIKDSDENSITISIKVLSNDNRNNEQVDSSLAYIVANSIISSDSDKDHIFNISNNNSSNITIIEKRDYLLRNPSINLKLMINEQSKDYGYIYWIENWQVQNDGKIVENTFGDNSNITYVIENSLVKQIIINCYITTLSSVEYDYNLADGETIENKVTTTKFAYAKSIRYSIDNYNAKFPIPTRDGFDFVAWTNGTSNVTYLTIWDKKYTKLTAVWQLQDIEVDNDNIKDNFIYDGLRHQYSFTIANSNAKAIEYTYKWVNTAQVSGEFANSTLRVKNVKNSGIYTLTITATNSGVSKTLTREVNVTITPFELLTVNIDISKQYDKSADISTMILQGALSEKIYITGSYYSRNAGSLLNKSTLAYIVKDGDLTVDNIYNDNYSIDLTKVNDQSKIIPKEISISFDDDSKVYDKTSLTATGNFNDGIISFSYTIKTAKLVNETLVECGDVGIYNQNNNNLLIEIENDLLSNFNFTISGTLTINYKTLLNSDVEWVGDKNVVFDGKTHTLVLSDEFKDAIESYKYEKNSVTLTSLPITVGEYTVTAIFKENSGYDVQEVIQTTLIISQRVLNVTYDSSKGKIEKVYDATDVVTIGIEEFNIETIVSGFEPIFVYNYRTVNAGDNVAIDISLEENNEINSNYVLAFPNGAIYGKINKALVNLTITDVSKQYDGTNRFEIDAKDIQATGLVQGENVGGSVVFIAKDVAKYNNQNSSLDIITSDLTFGGVIFSTNYEIQSFVYDIEITKADLILACSPRTPYTYSGEVIEIAYDLSRSDNLRNASLPTELVKVYYIKNGETYNQINYQPLQVGNYQIEFKLSSEDEVNYRIISTQTKFNYAITQKDLSIKFRIEFEYTGENAVYKADKVKNDIYILSKEIDNNTLGIGDSISWNFVTTGKDCGTYYIAQNEFVDPAEIIIYKGDEDYTHNYNIIINVEAQIVIKQASIDRSQISISSNGAVYNAKSHTLTFSVNGNKENFTYKSIKRDEVLIQGAENIKYAGEYSLEIELYNYKISNNKPFIYTISKKDVDLELLDISKVYDGTNIVEQDDYKFKDDVNICEEDIYSVYIVATYEDKNIGEKKKVKFVLQSASSLMQNSYNLLTTTGYGDITPLDKVLTLRTSKYSVFYNGNNVEINISNFAPSELVNREIISGIIRLNIKNVGEYDIASLDVSDIDISNLKITDAYGESVNVSNYSLSFAGTVEIKHALVSVNVKNLQYVYNAKMQTPTFEHSIYNESGELVDDFEYNVEYLQNNISVDPINAGEYIIKIILSDDSNYRFVRLDNGQVIPQKELTFVNTLNIAKRKIAINVSDTINKRYKYGINATYQVEAKDILDPTLEKTEGLLSIHKLTATLSTNDSIAKTYQVNGLSGDLIFDTSSEIYIKSLAINEADVDVTANYSIEGLTCTIIISNTSEEFDTDALETLIYDGTDKFASGEFYVIFLISGIENRFDINNNSYNGETVISELTYNGTSTDKIINAGSYSVRLKISIEGFSPIDTIFEFNVKQKEISVVDCNISKEYDNSSDVLGNLTSQDICYKNGIKDDVVIVGTYYNEQGEIVQTVGKDYIIKFTISGQDSSNYTIDSLSLKGEIVARKIILQIQDGYTLTFNNEIQYVDFNNLEIVSGSIIVGQSLVGRIKINNENAGTYELNSANIDISELKVQNGIEDFTENYEFIFNGNVTINSKNVDVTVNRIRLTYNGQVQTINEFLVFESLEEDLQEIAKTSILVSYDKEVIDAGSYEATISSNTNNFVFVVTGYTDNKIQFTVSKRNIIFSLGENPIQKVYNPTSDHKSNFEPEFVSGLIAGQELKGEYRLSQVGLGVGIYTQDPNYNENGYVIFDNLEIIAKGENIIDKNYNVLTKIGAVEIIPFEITKDNAYLNETQIVYSKSEALNSLTFTFFDANKQLQTITAQDNTLGTISLVETSAINVGTYHIKVTINNCTLTDGDEYEFEIIPFEITDIDYLSEKEYDATSNVVNGNNDTILTSSQVFAGDNIEIVGTYVDSDNIAVRNASQEDYTIIFAIKNADTLPAMNYQISITSKGKITQRVITLNVNKELVYKADGEYAIPYKQEDFTMIGTIVSGQTLEGIVKFKRQDTLGVIDLTQVDLSGLTVIDSDSINQTSNYLFKLDGTISINKSKITIDFSGISNIYIYNNSIVLINPIIKFEDENNTDTLPTFTYNYKSLEYNSENAPKDVGQYTFTVQLNSSFYEFSTKNTFTFEINAYDFMVSNGVIPADKFYKNFGDVDPELIFTTKTDFNETINLYFTRTQGEDVGVYDIQLVNWDNKNYNVTIENGKDLFRIKKASNTTVIILATEKNINLLQKQYDTKNIGSIDITLLDYDANGETLSGLITFEEGVNVGSYKVSAWTLSSLNFEQFNLTSEVEYVINKKDIILNGEDLDKPYDNSTKFYGLITILDSSNIELDENIYHLSAYGIYEDSKVSENVNILVNYAGESISNFNVTNTLSGKITKRNVRIVPKQDQEIVYGTTDFELLFDIQDLETTSFEGTLSSEIEGNLFIEYLSGKTKFVVGNYPIKSNITSNNFNLSFDDSVQFTITKKELTISNSNNFIKVFDGNNVVLGDFVIESGLIDGDIVEVSAKFYNSELNEDATVGIDKIVMFILSGEDGENYFAGNVKGSITNKIVKLNFVYYLEKDGMINYELIEENEISSFDLIYDTKIGDTQTFMPQPKHEGYSFVGWYLDENYTNQIDLNTVINSSIWSIDEEQKSVYAKWEIKSFNVTIVNVTKVNGVYSDDVSLQGGTSKSIEGKYNYYSVVDLNDIATPKTGYVFAGFSDDINASVNDKFITEGYTVLAKDNVIYAKFDPKTVKLTLFANEGLFTKSQKWTFDGGYTSAMVEVDFNSKLSDYGITIPTLSRDGYNLSGWQDANGNNISFDINTILGEDYFPERILYASWSARNYKLILNANGGVYSDFDTDIWTVEEQDEKGNVIKVSKAISFDSEIGELIEPIKKGWTFDSYTNSVTADLIFRQLNDISADAQYLENTYSLTIISKHHDIKVEIRNKDNVLISNYSLVAGNADRLVIDVSTTDNATITAIDTMGYIFKNWTSTYNLVDDESATIQILEFMQDETLTANYDFKENTITLRVNDKDQGYIYSGMNSTEGVGVITFTAKTESVVSISAVALEGYKLSGWIVDSNGIAYTLSGNDLDNIRELSNFICDIEILVNFEPKNVNISIVSDSTKGTISISGVIENVETYTYSALVDTSFTFTITANHGYSVDTNIDNWVFETASSQRANFVVRVNNNVYTITLTNFYESGTINIPFITNKYSVKFVAVYRNDKTFTRDLDVESLITLQTSGQSDILLNSNTPFEAIYKTQVKLIPKLDIREGYTFSCWSKSGSSEFVLSSMEGLVNTYDDNSIDFEILDDITVYLIYTINVYTIKYSVNDYQKGNVVYNDGIPQTNFAITIRYGYNAQKVEAQSNEHYEFVKWVRVVEGAYQDYSTEQILELTNIKEDMEFVAIFTGQPITITVKLILPEDEIITQETDFGKLSINENDSTRVSKTEQLENMMYYEISTIAGEKVILNLIEENGYEFSTITPYYLFDKVNKIITLSNIFESTEIQIILKARQNTIIVEISGDTYGATLSENFNTSNGVLSSRDLGNKKSYEFVVKTGGEVGLFLNILYGYKLITNTYFDIPVLSPGSNSSISNGHITNIKEDMHIYVEIQAFTYRVKFDYNYIDGPQSVTSDIKVGNSIFTPALDGSAMNPTRAKFRFVGWGFKSDSLDASYIFDNGNIYYYTYDGTKRIRTLGFAGSEYSEVSQVPGIDYECTLYALWEVITYKVDIVLVPSSTLSKIVYEDVLPNKVGRKIIFKDLVSLEVLGIEYEPGSEVIINAPLGNSGYRYYGWSYDEGIKDRTLLNTEQFSIIMPEDNIIVYLYYTLQVSINSYGNGEATASTKEVLYGESVTVNAVANDGYSFYFWTVNGSRIQDSVSQMSFVIEQPTSIFAKFIGKEVDVRLKQVDNATLYIDSKIQDVEGNFRVGDTIIFGLKDVTYGYFQKSWSGEYSGTINNRTYKITKEDAVRGYIEVALVMSQKAVKVEFVIDGSVGGEFEFDGQKVISTIRTYNYDSYLDIVLLTSKRYELVSLTLNDKPLDNNVRQLLIHQDNGFDSDATNVIRAKFRQILWVEVYEMFAGFGTENDPYVIYNERQLSAMAYLINNNIPAETTIPYAQGYYVLKTYMNLEERFWQPIGTKENPFDGTFDYVDNVVSNLELDKHYDVTNQNGLFGYITDNARFLRSEANYTLAIILISSIILIIILIILILWLWTRHKKKKMNKLATISSVAQNPKMMETIINSNLNKKEEQQENAQDKGKSDSK